MKVVMTTKQENVLHIVSKDFADWAIQSGSKCNTILFTGTEEACKKAYPKAAVVTGLPI